MEHPNRAAMKHPNRDRLDALFRRDRLAANLGAELRTWEGGSATLDWTPTADQVNFAGAVHGGAMFAVADAGFAVACNSWGRAAVALTVEVQYLAPLSPGEPVVVAATERARSRRTGSYLLELRRGDRLVASLQAMAFRTDRWHLGDDAWPPEWRERY